MIELGELEKHHEEFSKRHVKVVVISNDDQPTARETQAEFPHLVVVSDAQQSMAKALQVLHTGAGQNGDDTNAPTTFLVDGTGKVRWFVRPERILGRLAPDELLAAIDEAEQRK
jgi:alkyl hydroperoxide reductase subunit AhpC